MERVQYGTEVRAFTSPWGSAQELVRVADRDGEVRAAEAAQDGEVHTDDLAPVVEQRPARAARGGGCVIDDFVLQDVADMALCGRRPDQALLGQPRHDLRHVG